MVISAYGNEHDKAWWLLHSGPEVVTVAVKWMVVSDFQSVFICIDIKEYRMTTIKIEGESAGRKHAFVPW
jgi:hypothetical protein